MPDIFKYFFLTLAVLPALQPYSASSEAARELMEIKISPLSHADQTDRHVNEKTDHGSSRKLTSLESNVWLPIVKTLDKSIEHFTTKSHTKNNGKTSHILMDTIRQEQRKINTDKQETSTINIVTLEEPLPRRKAQRLAWEALSFTAAQAPNNDNLLDVNKTWRDLRSKLIINEDLHKNCEDFEINTDFRQPQNGHKCNLQRNSNILYGRSKREYRHGNMKESSNLSVPKSLDYVKTEYPSLKGENSFDDNFKKDIFMRVSRDRLDRMPKTYGKRDLEVMDSYYRSERDRLSRMPVTFGKRDTDDDKFNKFLMTVLQDILNRHVPAMNRDGDNDDEPVPFIRTSKGILHRMPLSFGKRTETFLDSIDNEVLYKTPAAKSSKTQIYKVPDITGLDINPFLLIPQNNGKNKVEEQSQLQLLESEDYTRQQRSKLDRMPLSFGKRNDNSNDIKNGASDIHNIKERSRIDRMPVIYGKRVYRDLTLVRMLSHVTRPEERKVLWDIIFENSNRKYSGDECLQTNDRRNV